MKCEKCNHHQDSGKFCGKCGGKLIELTEQAQEVTQTEQAAQQEQVEQAATVEPEVTEWKQEQANTGQTTQQSQTEQGFTQQTQANQDQAPNQHIEQVKETSKAFGNYYVRFIKQPSAIFTDSTQFVNGAIALLLFSLLFGIVTGVAIPSEMREALEISFISIFFNLFIFAIVILAAVILSTFLVFRFFGQEKSFKDIVNYYGVLSLPATSILPLTFILFLLGSYRFGYLTLILSFSLVASILPAYLVSSFQAKGAKTIDGIYGYLIYVGIYALLTFIIYSIILDSFMTKIQSSFLNSLFYF